MGKVREILMVRVMVVMGEREMVVMRVMMKVVEEMERVEGNGEEGR